MTLLEPADLISKAYLLHKNILTQFAYYHNTIMTFTHETVRALPTVVDEVAKTASNAPWVYIPSNNENIQHGYKAVTFGQLARSVNKLARWIEKNVGVSSTRETLAFMDRSNDIRYIFAILAAIKTGYKILLTSTRNAAEGQQFLIQQTQCRIFLHGAESKAEIESLRNDETVFRSYEIPSLAELLEGDAEHYAGNVSHDPMDTAIIIHTSGSTGLPKPINLRNGYIAGAYLFPQQKAPNGRKNLASVFFSPATSLCTLPFFHAMGLFSIVKSIFCQGPLILPPVGRIPTAEMNLEMIKAGKPQVGFFPPSILEDLAEMPGGMDALKTIDFILFAGAPLAFETGEKISKVARIQTIIGSTEAGLLDSYINEDPADWMYFEFCPWTGAHMDQQGELHELVIRRKGNNVQCCFFSFPEIEEWRTKDLYAEHPTKPGLWQYRGRNDDIIVLSNGEKFNPIAFEKYVEGHQDVKGAIVIGQGRFQAALILELNRPVDSEAFIEEIWPRVEKANEMVAAHGRVWKSKIAFAKEGKAFARAPKGSMIRRKTNDIFADEIEALYSNEGFADQLGQLDADANQDAVKEFVQKAIGLTMPNVPANVNESADIFEYGVDSLQVLGLASALTSALPKVEGVRGNAIKGRTIYSNPTIKSMSQAVHGIITGAGSDKPTISREQRMAESIEKFTANLPAPVEYNPRQQKHAVVLTGSTGSLGNYLLEYLIAAPNVAKVYCMNRSDAQDRQKKSFEERGANPDFSKVTFLQTSFDQERFGLTPEIYHELQQNVDLFIHNAWAVNFNMDLESFEPTHVAGTRRVVDFSATSQYHPHIIFISSIASTGAWLAAGNSGPVPEKFMLDHSLPLPQGYGESKHVGGSILAIAAEKSHIPASIVRVGQLGGPDSDKGLWNKQEWLPSIIASSKAIGKIPRVLGADDVVDWVPVDDAANVLIDIAKTRFATQKETKLDTFHLVNPKIARWSVLVTAVTEYYAAQGTDLEVVEFEEWLNVMKSLPVTQEEVARVPGLKLLEFYEGLTQGGFPRMATSHTEEASVTLKELSPIRKELITKWLKQWQF